MGLTLAHHQVLALDQQKAEIAGQVRLFEIGFAIGARRQKADARLGAGGRGGEAVAKGAEEGRQPFHIHAVVQGRIGPRQHQPVLQRIARARRRLAAVVQHPPAPVRTPAQVGGIEVHIAPARRVDSAQRPHIVGAARDHSGGQEALAHQASRAVEVLEHGLHQLGPLLDSLANVQPLAMAEDQRQRVDRPGALGRLAIDAVGHPGVADVPGGQGEAFVQRLGRRLGQVAEEAQPIVARLALAVDQFVGNAGQGLVAIQPVHQPRIAPRTLQALGLTGQRTSLGPRSSETRPPALQAAR